MGAVIIPGHFQRPIPNTPEGDQLRDLFESQVLDICGDVRLFWLPRLTETTTSTDRSRNADTFTYNATVASQYGVQGSGVTVAFDAISAEATVPDVARLSFGDGSIDNPFSIVAWANVTNSAAYRTILAKVDYTTGTELREWVMWVDPSDRVTLELHDESANANLGRRYNTPITMGSWKMFCATYDGSGDALGIRLYQDGTRIDDTTANTGTYTAMENLATVVRLGGHIGTGGTATGFMDGSLAAVVLCAKRLSQDEIFNLKVLGNGYFAFNPAL